MEWFDLSAHLWLHSSDFRIELGDERFLVDLDHLSKVFGGVLNDVLRIALLLLVSVFRHLPPLLKVVLLPVSLHRWVSLLPHRTLLVQLLI